MLLGTVPLLGKTGVGGIDAYTKLLLHMEGANNGTSFTDSSLNNKTISINGGTQYITSTTQKKFGATSGTRNGANGALYVPNTSGGDPDLAMGAGDWTWDFWVYPTATAGGIIDGRPGSTEGAYPTVTFASSKFSYFTSSAYRIQSATKSFNTWYHVAVVRASGTTKLYVDGTQEGVNYTDSATYLNGNNRPFIGNDNSASGPFTGFLDEVRISKGIARWTANFTPPTQPYSL